MTPKEKMAWLKNPKNQDDEKKYDKAANSYAIEEFLNLEFIGRVEDSLECSGFCKPALFYWN